MWKTLLGKLFMCVMAMIFYTLIICGIIGLFEAYAAWLVK